jgi:hypothetical protein
MPNNIMKHKAPPLDTVAETVAPAAPIAANPNKPAPLSWPVTRRYKANAQSAESMEENSFGSVP